MTGGIARSGKEYFCTIGLRKHVMVRCHHGQSNQLITVSLSLAVNANMIIIKYNGIHYKCLTWFRLLHACMALTNPCEHGMGLRTSYH